MSPLMSTKRVVAAFANNLISLNQRRSVFSTYTKTLHYKLSAGRLLRVFDRLRTRLFSSNAAFTSLMFALFFDAPRTRNDKG